MVATSSKSHRGQLMKIKYFAEVEGVEIPIQSLIWNERGKARAGTFSFEVWDPEVPVREKLVPSKIFELWIGYVPDPDTAVKGDLQKLAGILKAPEKTPLQDKLLWVMEGVDLSAIAYNFVVNRAYSGDRPDEILIDAWQSFGPSGITFAQVATAPFTVEDIRFPHDTLFQVTEEMSDFTGWPWRVNADLELVFKPAEDDFYGLLTGQDFVLNTINLTEDGSRLANRVWVFGAFVTIDTPISERFVGNDASHTFKLAYSPIFESISVLRGGVGQTVGRDDIDTFATHNVLVNTAQQVLRFDPTSPPGSGVAVIIEYDYGFPVIARREDTASINEYGVHEHVIVDAKIRSNAVAAEIARAHIREYAYPSTLIRAETSAFDIRAGQSVEVQHTTLGVSKVFTVDQVDREVRGPEDARCTVMLRASPPQSTLEGKIKSLDERIHALETRDIPEEAPVNTYESVSDDVSLTDAVTLVQAPPESRVGHARVGYSQVAP